MPYSAAADVYANSIQSVMSLGRSARIITPGATDLNPIAKSVVLLTGGNVSIVPVLGSDSTPLDFVGLTAGYVFPFQVRRVTASTAVVAAIDG